MSNDFEPASDRQIELMREFWDHYGSHPHVRELNASLLKKDFLSLISRISIIESKNLIMISAFQKIEDAAVGGYLTPDLCAEIVQNALYPNPIQRNI